MRISHKLRVGDSINYRKEEILDSIRQGKLPEFYHWYAITTTFEKSNLFYILSGLEYRHPMYHRPEQELTLIGIAGSKGEATDMVQSILQEFVDSDAILMARELLRKW